VAQGITRRGPPRALGSHPCGQAAEGGAEGVLQQLPGVVFPKLAQFQAGVLALMDVTFGRHPGMKRDQDRAVVAGKVGGLAQGMHAAR
jgi:hypothetical protein